MKCQDPAVYLMLRIFACFTVAGDKNLGALFSACQENCVSTGTVNVSGSSHPLNDLFLEVSCCAKSGSE